MKQNKEYNRMIAELDILLENKFISQMEWYFALLKIRAKYNLPLIK